MLAKLMKLKLIEQFASVTLLTSNYRILQIIRGGKVLRFLRVDQYHETFPLQ